MRVGLLQEGEVPPGTPIAQRYHEMIDEVVLADSLGFSTWGTSEQHFSPPRFTVSAPEVLYAAVAAKTQHITLRPMASVLLQWNHPILIAERLATLDIVSNGRAELCTARSNNLHTLGAFGVNPKETAEQWEESFQILVKALTEETLSHEGRFWNIPERTIVPRHTQDPHPLLSVAASSAASHTKAAEKGIGVIAFENYFGYDYLQECIDAFRAAEPGPNAVPRRNDQMGLYVATAFCAETREEAKRVAADVVFGYFKFILDLYIPLSKQPGYTYLDRIEALLANQDDLDWLINETASVMVGTPDDFVRELKMLEERGVDEVLLRVDGMGHEHHMRAIELIGREVIPVVDRMAVATA